MAEDMPRCLAWRTVTTGAGGQTTFVEQCACGDTLISTAATPEEAERLARKSRAPHVDHGRRRRPDPRFLAVSDG